jgi:hypothetical protein
VSATYPPDYCGHCSLNVDWCQCDTCQCGRFIALCDTPDAPEFCKRCEADEIAQCDTIPPPASHEVAKPARVVLRDMRHA